MPLTFEKYFGLLQGRKRFKSDAERKAWKDDSAETISAFEARTFSWWEKTLLRDISQLSARDTAYDILVVTHGGFISTLVRSLMQTKKLKSAAKRELEASSIVWNCPNTSVTIIDVEQQEVGISAAELVQYAGIEHLKLESNLVQNNVDVEPLEYKR